MLAGDALAERVRRRAAERPGGAAVVESTGTVTTWAAMAAAVAEEQHGARQSGGPPGSRIPLLVTNDARSMARIVALLAEGYSPLLLDPGITPAERGRVEDLMRLDERPDPDAAEAAPPAAECVLVTSGSDGPPKVVVKPWRHTLRNAVAFARMADYRPTDSILCTTPLHHAFALGVVMLPALHRGMTTVMAPHPPSPGALAAALVEHRTSIVQSVPSLYAKALEHLTGKPADLRLCVSAGAPLSPELAAAWRTETGLPLRSQYGSTELGQIAFAPEEGTKPGMRLVPGVTACTMRDGRRTPEGEICVSMDEGRIRYAGLPDLTTASFHGHWLRTGDWGRVTGTGHIVLESRMSRRIVRAGRKVDPVEVEKAIVACEGVRDAVVAPLPHSAEEDVIAFVAADPGVRELTLRRELATVLSPYKIPTRFHLRASLPRTRTGKIRMPQLWADMERKEESR